MKALAVLLVTLLLLPAVPAQRSLTASDIVEVTAVAVAQTPTGLVGVTATVQATAIKGGSGQVFVDTKPLAQTDMQGSARQAARVAADTLGLDWRNYDYLVVFRSKSVVIGGPSAGAVMTLGLAAALWSVEHPGSPWDLDAHVAATGTINPDGTIGPVGGVPAKAEGAKNAGMQTFLYPAGLERFQVRDGSRIREGTMDRHCAALGLQCRAVATIQEVIGIAARVAVGQPQPPTPATAEYGALLEPRVAPEIDRLRERLQAANANPSTATGQRGQLIAQALETAHARAAEAHEAENGTRYYTAATQAFQGHIQVAYAENLTRFYAAQLDGAIVEDAIATCKRSLDAAAASLTGPEPGTLNAMMARGAAARRLIDATQLLQQAQSAFQGAFTRDQWAQALFHAAFCSERARTATWWAELEGLFGPGPAVASPAALLADVLEEAREMVVYAQAVTGGSAGATQLNEAQQHQEAGRYAAGLLAAVDAQVSASVAMQTATGAAISKDILDAASAAAARAIGRARAGGAEPMLAVSMVELATDQSDANLALANFWAARSIALLGTAGPAQAPVISALPRPAEDTVAVFVVGALAGAALVALVALSMVAVVSVRSKRAQHRHDQERQSHGHRMPRESYERYLHAEPTRRIDSEQRRRAAREQESAPQRGYGDQERRPGGSPRRVQFDQAQNRWYVAEEVREQHRQGRDGGQR